MREHFTTANVATGERYDFWHEVVCRMFVTADSVRTGEGGFDAELTCADFGRAQVSLLNAPAHHWERNRRHVRQDDQDVYLLGVLRSGTAALEQAGNAVLQRRGSIVLYDTALPFSYDLSASINILTLPRTLLDARAPHAKRLLARELECDAGLSAMLCEMIDLLIDLDVQADSLSIVRERLASSLLDIVLAVLDLNSAAFTESGCDNPSLEKMLAGARANLGDPDLSPAVIAGFGAVSTRTMNRLFGRLGTTPMRWVLLERVRLGERYLREGRAKSVTEAAMMVGFNDISHFSRSFKQLLGSTPEQVLRQGERGG